jgi:hypothetical protein
MVAMFAREASFAAQLTHSNITQVYDHGLLDGRPFIAMEYVHGVSLKALLNAHQAAGTLLPVGLAVFVASQVAAALDYAHRKTALDGKPLDIVHRDVSPQNVLLSVDGEVKLTDFGMAKGSGPRGVYRTQETSLKGKLAYLSPEQASGLPVGQQSDVFSFGIVFYELLSGRHPFSGDLEPALVVLDRIKRGLVEPVEVLRPEVPASIASVLAGCLRREPGERCRSAHDVLLALDRARASHAPAAGAVQLASHIAALGLAPSLPALGAGSARGMTLESAVPLVRVPLPADNVTRESDKPVGEHLHLSGPQTADISNEQTDAFRTARGQSKRHLALLAAVAVTGGVVVWLEVVDWPNDGLAAAPVPGVQGSKEVPPRPPFLTRCVKPPPAPAMPSWGIRFHATERVVLEVDGLRVAEGAEGAHALSSNTHQLRFLLAAGEWIRVDIHDARRQGSRGISVSASSRMQAELDHAAIGGTPVHGVELGSVGSVLTFCGSHVGLSLAWR